MAGETTKKKDVAYAKKKGDTYTGLAVQLKRQMDDIIDVAYGTDMPQRIRQFKRFTIFCTSAEYKSVLGDCTYNPDGSSSIRIMRMASESDRAVMITVIHEVTHHIDKSIRGKSGHDAPYYEAHKRLLCAALDMGILTMDDILKSDTDARNREKVARMMRGYIPRDIGYKKDVVTVAVYNSFRFKDRLKTAQYRWNGLDQSWGKEIPKTALEQEKAFLISIGATENDISVSTRSGVMLRQRMRARVYGVPYEFNANIKALGFRWAKTGEKGGCWEKILEEDRLSDVEDRVIKKLQEKVPGITVTIS